MTQRHIISDLSELYAASGAIQEYGTYDVPELGIKVAEHPQVLSPRVSFSGIWTAQNWDLGGGMSVLDMGTGTGVLGVSAIVRAGASRVLSADISPFAVECATRTAAMNAVSDKMSVVRSDLFKNLPEIPDACHFDRIIFNPPFWDKQPDPNNKLTLASCDPGRRILKRFLRGVPERLQHLDSRALIVFSTQHNFNVVDSIIRGAKGLAVKNTFEETVGHPRVLFSLGRTA